MSGLEATPNNMAKLATILTPGARLLAYSPRTFEEYSATPGDYWDRPGDEPLRDANGDPMVLAYRYETVVIVDGDES